MSIQLGTVTPPAAGSTAARAPTLPGASGASDNAKPPPPAPTQPQAAAPTQAPLSNDAVKQVASQINEFIKSSSSSLQFMVDDDTSKVVVRIVDLHTNEVIRQIPSEEMLAISRSLDQMSGLLIQQKA